MARNSCSQAQAKIARRFSRALFAVRPGFEPPFSAAWSCNQFKKSRMWDRLIWSTSTPLPQAVHSVTLDLYSLRVPPASFLAARYFAEIASRLLDRVTTPGPSTCHLHVGLLRQPIAGELASCWISDHCRENGLAATSQHTSSKIGRNPGANRVEATRSGLPPHRDAGNSYPGRRGRSTWRLASSSSRNCSLTGSHFNRRPTCRVILAR